MTNREANAALHKAPFKAINRLRALREWENGPSLASFILLNYLSDADDWRAYKKYCAFVDYLFDHYLPEGYFKGCHDWYDVFDRIESLLRPVVEHQYCSSQ